MDFVGFFASMGSPPRPTVLRPNMHMSAVTVLTLGCAERLFTAGSAQLLAVSGCSCRKCLPPRNWKA